MPLIKMFQTSPVLGLSFLLLMACIVLTARTLRRTRTRNDRFLLGFLGLLAIHESFRILKDAGVLTAATSRWDDLGRLAVAAAFVLAVLLVRIESLMHYSTRVLLRIWESIAR